MLWGYGTVYTLCAHADAYVYTLEMLVDNHHAILQLLGFFLFCCYVSATAVQLGDIG